MADQRKQTIVMTSITGPGLDRPLPRREGTAARPTAAEPPRAIPFDPSSATRDPTLDDASLEVADPVSVPRVLRRLAIAAILIALLSVLFWVVLPSFGMVLHPILPALAIVAIAVGTLLNASESEQKPECASDDEGRPVGCCSGPRPPRFLRK